MKNRLWLTYAWRDNEDQDIDFLIQKLGEAGLEVKYDRATLLAGRPLWDQLDAQIDWGNIDAWAIYVTRGSLESEPCREELSYALSLAIRYGRMTFPLIGVLPEAVSPEVIPKAISTRLYVNLNDPSAIQQIVDGVRGIKSKPDVKVPPIQLRWYDNVFMGLPAVEFWPSMSSLHDVFVTYECGTAIEDPSPSLATWCAPVVGTKNKPNFNSRSAVHIEVMGGIGYLQIRTGGLVTYGQSASSIVPRCALNRPMFGGGSNS